MILQSPREQEYVLIDDLVHVGFAWAIVDQKPWMPALAAHAGQEASQIEADDSPGSPERLAGRLVRPRGQPVAEVQYQFPRRLPEQPRRDVLEDVVQFSHCTSPTAVPCTPLPLGLRRLALNPAKLSRKL